MKTGVVIAIGGLVFCVCVAVIIGALFATGVIGGKKSPSSSASGTPSGSPSPRTPSRTPGTPPGAYSGPSYASTPASGPVSVPATQNSSGGIDSCPPGQWLQGDHCTTCGYNTYKSTSGTDISECIACPPGTTNFHTDGATSSSACLSDCVGSWGPCQGTCGTGQMTYTVTSPGGPGARACEAQNGQVGYCQLPNECSSRQELLSQPAAQGSKDTCPLASDGPCNHDDDCPNFNNGSMCQDNGFGLKCCT